MKIPKKIKIGNITYDVKFDNFEDEPDALGFHDITTKGGVIKLNKTLKGEILENVFFHELCHGILYQIGGDHDNELLVQSMANMVQQTFEQLKKL